MTICQNALLLDLDREMLADPRQLARDLLGAVADGGDVAAGVGDPAAEVAGEVAPGILDVGYACRRRRPAAAGAPLASQS